MHTIQVSLALGVHLTFGTTVANVPRALSKFLLNLFKIVIVVVITKSIKVKV